MSYGAGSVMTRAVGRSFADALPYVALLPDGTRVHAMLSTISGPGTCPSFARAAEADALAPKAGCLRHDLDGCAALLRRMVEANARCPARACSSV
jgi:hypothetical protein